MPQDRCIIASRTHLNNAVYALTRLATTEAARGSLEHGRAKRQAEAAVITAAWLLVLAQSRSRQPPTDGGT